MRVIVWLSVVHIVAEAFCRFSNQLKVSKSKIIIRSPSIGPPVLLSSSIEDLLREKFTKTMKSNNTRSFSSWSNFERSLPRRKYDVKGISSYLPLYTLEYYSRDDDLQKFADEIMQTPKNIEKQIRTCVKYIAAPPSSGKTSCILPAFLKTKLTHYFYVAFDNNQENNYRLYSGSSMMSSIPDKAHQQGADFMFQCIKTFLDPKSSGPHRIECNLNPADFQTTVDELQKYLDKKLGDQHQCLFHLDEHRKICPRGSDDDTGKDFSRGAMELLARVSRAQVVATYTDLPSLPPEGSSGMCRKPLKMPIFNMNQVMEKAVPELRITIPSNAPRSFHRKLATLKLRLSMTIRRLGITSVLHVRHDCPETETFLAAFQAAAALVGEDEKNALDALEACMKLCEFQTSLNIGADPNAAALLLGIPETERFNDMYRQLSDLQLVGYGLFTTSLGSLLARWDPNIEVYNKGLIKFLSMLESDDYLSSTPLETAYIWTLSTRSAVAGVLKIYKSLFTIKCNNLEPARLFPGDNSSICDTAFLRQDVLYYADERNGKPTHPLADIFFITKDQQLVLVDVAGGDDKKVMQKRKNLLAWIEANGGCIDGYTLHGVVLAPYDITGKTSSLTRVPNTNDESSAVEVVRGMAARRLLGGLDQIYVWLE